MGGGRASPLSRVSGGGAGGGGLSIHKHQSTRQPDSPLPSQGRGAGGVRPIYPRPPSTMRQTSTPPRPFPTTPKLRTPPMTAQAFCTDCGTARVAEAKFCGTCGTPFSSPQINPPTPPQTPPQSPALRTPEDLVRTWLSLACLAPYPVWSITRAPRYDSLPQLYVALISHTNKYQKAPIPMN